jgi:hypothetical protein
LGGPAPARTKVFVSYSHADQVWRQRLITHLAVLERKGVIETWSDTRLQIGDSWKSKIDQALAECQVAVLLVSPNFLASRFIQTVEVQQLLERHMRGGLQLLPVIARPCAWKLVDFLSGRQARPEGGRALSLGTEPQIDQALAMITYELAVLVGQAGREAGREMDRLLTSTTEEAIVRNSDEPRMPDLGGGSWTGRYGPQGGSSNRIMKLSVESPVQGTFNGRVQWSDIVGDMPRTTTLVEGTVNSIGTASVPEEIWSELLDKADEPVLQLTFVETAQEGDPIDMDGRYYAVLQRDTAILGTWSRRTPVKAVGEFSLSKTLG